MTRRQRQCKNCGGKSLSNISLCKNCQRGPGSVNVSDRQEEADIVNYDEEMEDFRDELSEMYSRSDDDGWAYADDPCEDMADPNWRKLFRRDL